MLCYAGYTLYANIKHPLSLRYTVLCTRKKIERVTKCMLYDNIRRMLNLHLVYRRHLNRIILFGPEKLLAWDKIHSGLRQRQDRWK